MLAKRIQSQAFLAIVFMTIDSAPARPLRVVGVERTKAVAPNQVLEGVEANADTRRSIEMLDDVGLTDMWDLVGVVPATAHECARADSFGAVVPPTAPFALTGGVSGQTVTLSWAAPPIGTGPFTYVPEVGTAPGQTDLQVPSAVSAVVAAGVAPGIYYVRVRAIGAAGPSPSSNEVVLVVQ